MIDDIRMAIGIASVSNDALAYQRNCNMVIISRPLPTRSSIYFHSICIINTKNAMKNVTIKGPIKDLKISMSNFFIIPGHINCHYELKSLIFQND